MDNFPFKTLSEAKELYSALAEKVVDFEAKVASIATLTSLNVDLTAARDLLATEKADLESKFEAFNLGSTAKIEAKDAEISTLKSEKEALKTSFAELKANQKTAKGFARELVAASSAPAPASVDTSEVELGGKELMKAMNAERDPDKLYALYETFKRQSSTAK